MTNSKQAPQGAFREMPYMGVIYVVVEAMKLGYSQEDPSWANLGQGQPEVGILPEAPPRFDHIPVLPSDYAYGPVDGLKDLKDSVAQHYNRLYRHGHKSKYSAENVVIAAGGRTTLTRAIAALDSVRLGYFTPDYTAYEDILSSFRQVHPILIPLSPTNGFSIDPTQLKTIIRREELGALLISNPCNPTGKVISGKELHSWVEVCRETSCSLLLDEYYSHYIWKASANGKPVSAAEYIEDVNQDPIVMFDGLTKNFRYPGWRLGWAIGPKDMVRQITAAGSFIDGGPPRPIQRAAVSILEPERADMETNAVRKAFFEKMKLTVEKLKEVGISFPLEPEGTFYAFGDISKLPPPLNDCQNFFRSALQSKVLTVPGVFFDVNPRKERTGTSPLQNFVRFSYGPPKDILLGGLTRLQEMIRQA